MKALVTGGAGFMGSHVAEELVTAGHDVVVLDDLSGGFTENLPDGVTFIEGSIVDQTLIKQIFQEHQFDHVYHLAAYAAEGLSHFIRHFNYENNLIGSVNLINAAVNHGVKSFVFTSSIAVYGGQEPPFVETSYPLPEDPYAIAKFAIEMDLKVAHEMWGMNFIIFRPHNVYGERQNIGDKYRNVIGIFMNQLMQDKEITIFGDGAQTRAFTYIRDISSIIAQSVFEPKAQNEVFNLGSSTPYSVSELAESVQSAMGKSGKIKYLQARNEVVHAYSDHQKVADIFGPLTTTPLEEGLVKMAQWAQQTGSRSSQEFDHIEIRNKLPEGW
ncbi:NAD-dependent epimerase/dehydratase family protein [Magnetococcus sp. PR-3]|uniref:NAD-dependent epimerase/dehydratase family protein n=1 Tax=Magnetococcus sp. PR-3 TaxID=3120355 RepID=UPI002FCE57F8